MQSLQHITRELVRGSMKADRAFLKPHMGQSTSKLRLSDGIQFMETALKAERVVDWHKVKIKMDP